MRINGLQNKFEIFQDFYYEVNGVKITYSEAVKLYYKMDEVTQTDFAQYCADKVEYQLIYDDSAIPYITSASGYNLDFIDRNLTAAKKMLLAEKYSIEAYAAKNGLKLDPVWGQYSAKEIISMSENGVVIPKDIVDIAHTIMQTDTANFEGANGESEEREGNNSEKTEQEIFLELVPKAKKHIDKCHDKEAKIDEKITDIVRDNGGIQKSFEEKMEKQKNALKEYEQMIREWRELQNKINNGEELTDTEARKYAQITGMLEDKNNSAADFKLDKLSIARNLNDINILAVLGEQLADETIEIGDQLADYVSDANYKTTRTQLTGEIGFLRAITAMLNGKTLAKEANKVGHEAKDYTKETKDSIKDIAGLLGVEKMIVSPSTQPESDKPADIENAEETIETEGTDAQEELPATENEQETQAAAEKENETAEEDFIVNDDNILALIDEASQINSDLLKQISRAISDTKTATEDKNFADSALKIVSKIIENYKKEEERRQEEIAAKEEENQKAQEKIEELGGGEDENEETINGINVKGITDEEPKNEHQDEIDEQQAIVDQNNIDIKAINEESAVAKDEVKNATHSYKERVDKTVPEETKALENDNQYKNEIIPEDKERLSFILSNGKTLFKMGTYRVEVGMEQIAQWQFKKGFRNISKGTTSQGIGTKAVSYSSTPILNTAEKTTENVVGAEENAIESLTNLDNTIIGVTDEKAASEYITEEKEDGESENDESENNEGNTEGTENNNDVNEPPAPTEESTPITKPTGTEETKIPIENSPSGESVPTEEPAAVEEPSTVVEPVGANNGGKVVGGGKEMSEEEKAQAAGEMAEKEEKNQKKQTDKQEDIVKETNKSAKDDAKESKKIEKDEKKSAKQLEKEAKKIEQNIKKEEQDLIKMVKESEEAAKKQEELLVRYEVLTQENETIAAEEEQKKSEAPAAPVQQPDNAQDGNGMTGATNSFGITDSSKSSASDNLEKLNANNQEITTISAQFGIAGNKITRNRVKILKIEKNIKTSTKKFQKKTKLKQKKIKDQQKKEMKKQKRLQQQLAIVGIAENVFSITSTTGMVLTEIGTPMIPEGQALIAAGEALLCWPTTAMGIAMIASGTILEVNGTTLTTVGGVLSTIGLYGTLACGVTKAAINIANGNLTAGLMALGQTAIAAVAGATGTGSAASSTLGMVSQGLSVVSNSAQLVNNVRVASGKEANGTMSKIGTVAGVGSALAGAGSSMSELGKNGASSLNQAAQVVGAVGTVASSASQLMTEFGWGDEKTANILGAVGGAMSTIGAIGQIATNKKEDVDNKNKANTDEVQQNTDSQNDATDTNTNDSAPGQPKPNSPEEQAAPADPAAPVNSATPATTTQSEADPNATTNTKPTDEVKPVEAPEIENPTDNAATIETQGNIEDNARTEQTKEQKKQERIDAKNDIEAHEKLVDRQSTAAEGLEGDARQNVLENGASAEFADVDDAALKEKIAAAKANGASEAEINKLDAEQQRRADFKASAQKAQEGKAKLKEYRNQKLNKIGNIMDITGKTLSAGAQIIAMFATKDNAGAGKKIKNKGFYDSRYLKAKKYLATSSSNETYFGGGHNDDQKRRFKKFAKRI